MIEDRFILTPGSHFRDRYEILQTGMGLVGERYQARDLVSGEHRTIKVLRERPENATNSLFAGLQSLKNCEHPNLERIFDFGYIDDGLPYIITEWLEGKTLQKRLETGTIFADDIRRISAGVCAGLGMAHQNGVLFDVTAANTVLIRGADGTETAKLADFGLQRWFSESIIELRMYEMMMPLWNGILGVAELIGGPAGNLLALGVVMREMAAGPAMRDRTLPGTYLLPHRPELPPDLMATIRKTSPGEGERYSSAAQMLADLSRGDVAGNADAEDLASALWDARTAASFQPSVEGMVTPIGAHASPDGRLVTIAEIASEDGEANLLFIGEKKLALRRGWRRIALHVRGDRIALQHSLTGIVEIWAISAATKIRRIAVWGQEPVRAAEFSPDGSRLACTITYLGIMGCVEIHPDIGASRMYRMARFDSFTHMAWSADGKSLLLADTGRWIHRVDSDRACRIAQCRGVKTIDGLAANHDGTLFAVTENTTVHIGRPKQGIISTLSTEEGGIRIFFAPGRDLLAIASQRGLEFWIFPGCLRVAHVEFDRRRDVASLHFRFLNDRQVEWGWIGHAADNATRYTLQ